MAVKIRMTYVGIHNAALQAERTCAETTRWNFVN